MEMVTQERRDSFIFQMESETEEKINDDCTRAVYKPFISRQ